MKVLFGSSADYMSWVKDVCLGLKKGSSVCMSTYGLFSNSLKDFFLPDLDYRLIVGVHYLICQPDCDMCKAKAVNTSSIYQRFLDSKPDNVSVQFVANHHLKCFLSDRIMITGGMNIGPSGWNDAMVSIEQKAIINQYQEYFNELWDSFSGEHCFYNHHAPTEKIMLFGRYKGKTYDWIKKENPTYFPFLDKKGISY